MPAIARQPAATAQPMSRLASGKFVWGLSIVARALQRLSGGRAALYAYLICAQPLGRGAFSALRSDAGTEIRRVLVGDHLLDALPRPAAVLKRRFATGATCHVAVVKGKFGGCIWLARGHYDEDEVRCRYVLPSQPASVWDFDVYVEPSLRLSRTLGRMWKAVDQELASDGVEWSFSRISLYNAASVQAHERMGAVRVATALFLQVGSLQLSAFTQRPYLHIGFGPGQTPALVLSAPG
jgi:hypothetical protein